MWTFRRFYFKLRVRETRARRIGATKDTEGTKNQGHKAGRRSACEAGRRRAKVRQRKQTAPISPCGLFPVTHLRAWPPTAARRPSSLCSLPLCSSCPLWLQIFVLLSSGG